MQIAKGGRQGGEEEVEEAWQRHQVVVSALFELTHWKLKRVGERAAGKGREAEQAVRVALFPPLSFLSASLPLLFLSLLLMARQTELS